MKLTKIDYTTLNSRAQENYNFTKVDALLADYGFTCLRLSDDWNGADFIALHINGDSIKVQLKSRLTIGAEYTDKGVWIAFPEGTDWYLFPHDEVQDYFVARGRKDSFSCHYIPTRHRDYLGQFKL